MITKSELKQMLASEYSPEFVQLLDQMGILNLLKKCTNEKRLLAVSSIMAELSEQYKVYQDLRSELYMIQSNWNLENLSMLEE